jgi:pimeloyl-ACP methyl ester carboxylesterase
MGGWLLLQQGDPRPAGGRVPGNHRAERPRHRQGDIAAVKRGLGRVNSPAILVGHSYAGSVITGAGVDDRVAGLVYIAALAPDHDETTQEHQDKFPTTEVFQHIEVAEARIWLLPSGIGCFCGDLPQAEQQLVWAAQGVPDVNLFNQKLPGTAWRTKPSWYVVATHDQTVHPELQRAAAKRMSATVYEVESSHVPMLSHPDVVIEAILAAANGI